MATFQGKQDLSSVDSHVPGLTGFTERPKRSFDTPSSAKKCFIQLGCCPHLQFWDAPVLQQPMGCVLGLSTCKNHVPSHCSAHKLPLEISNLFFLGFPPVLTWVTVQWLLLSACMSTALPLPPTHPQESPETCLWLQQEGHRGARVSTPSADSGFTDTWLPKAYKRLQLSPTPLSSKAKGIQID